MNWIAPWNVVHACQDCADGWVCEAHPNLPWQHDGCGAAGAPCQGLLMATEQFELDARNVLGDPDED